MHNMRIKVLWLSLKEGDKQASIYHGVKSLFMLSFKVL